MLPRSGIGSSFDSDKQCKLLPLKMQLIIFLFASLASCLAIRLQSVGITGRLMCRDKPAAGVKVELWDRDDGPDPDDLLAKGVTDAIGNINLKGSETETTNIDPVFKVYHDCDDGFKLGQRKLEFRIPDSYITWGKTPKRMFNISVLNLETIFPEEERTLI
ncbi:hypothetical protein Aduo_010744 [Ancylostoma duodenale]